MTVLLSTRKEWEMTTYFCSLLHLHFQEEEERPRKRRLAGKLPGLQVHRGVVSQLPWPGALPLSNRCSDPKIHLYFAENAHAQNIKIFPHNISILINCIPFSLLLFHSVKQNWSTNIKFKVWLYVLGSSGESWHNIMPTLLVVSLSDIWIPQKKNL